MSKMGIAVNNFFSQLASRAGKMEKLLARIEKYQPETKNDKNEVEPQAKKEIKKKKKKEKKWWVTFSNRPNSWFYGVNQCYYFNIDDVFFNDWV